jgi:NAD(P)-dependent dehydrogenase (short-subunit alcohol dehydrogenase family)
MQLGLAGKTALVTGADSGIGWQTARLLLAEGATVVLSDKEQTELDAAVERLGAPEGRAHGFAADVTSVDELTGLHDRVREAVGEIDVLVQCAGVTGAQGLFHEIDDEGWTSTIETDLLGPVRLVREFLPDLRSGGWGRLVLVTSEDAVQPYEDELPYCATAPWRTTEGRRAVVRQGAVAQLRERGPAREHRVARVHRDADDRRHDDEAG